MLDGLPARRHDPPPLPAIPGLGLPDRAVQLVPARSSHQDVGGVTSHVLKSRLVGQLMLSGVYEFQPLPRSTEAAVRDLVERRWYRSAVCAQVDPDLFDTDLIDDAGIRLARRVCAGCPVLRSCLASALMHPEYGIWAGTTETERSAAREDLATASTFDQILARYAPAPRPAVEPGVAA